MGTLSRLEKTIASRSQANPKKSYVAKLHNRGLEQITKKLGEEAVEVVIAALTGKDKDVIAEGADLMFHFLMTLNARGLSMADVLAELESREGISGIEEKANRKKG